MGQEIGLNALISGTILESHPFEELQKCVYSCVFLFSEGFISNPAAEASSSAQKWTFVAG